MTQMESRITAPLLQARNSDGGSQPLERWGIDSEYGCVLIGYTGLRGEESSARQVGGWMEAEGIEVRYAPIDEYYVHIDLMVCMLAEKLCAVCLDTTDPGIVDWLTGKKIEIVPVS